MEKEKIKAKELRIGNLVHSLVTDNEIQISQVNPSINVSGIPLTEEWLNILGFRWNEELNAYELPLQFGYSPFVISKGINVDIQNWEFYHVISKTVINRRIKYVHTLQNLIFALTGEELTPKE